MILTLRVVAWVSYVYGCILALISVEAAILVFIYGLGLTLAASRLEMRGVE